ncbi:tyrosine-protein phosphatase [Agreia sp. COWG]|uniref:tyrosine-protein phosphatase n=1 Tax=Agreia sp. COWG TaxID=2773266 RepID=UPI00351C5F18
MRSADEVGKREGDPRSTPPSAVPVTLAPTEDQSDPEFRAVCMPILDSPEYWDHNVRILPQLIRRALEAIARSEPGILVHCGAGRDRTGMISALLLSNAGVSTDDVVADYATSVRSMAGTGPQPQPVSDRQASWSPAEVDRWLREVETFVRAFASDVDEILDRLDVDASTRVRLRSLLTQPG